MLFLLSSSRSVPVTQLHCTVTKKRGKEFLTFFYPIFLKLHLSYNTTSSCGFTYFIVCQISYLN